MTSGGDWVEQARRLMESLGVAGAATSSSPSSSGSGTDCRWCPLCQAAAVLRGERPEVSAALADILAATATALRQFAGEPAASDAPPQADTGSQEPPPPVQRIELA